TSPLRCPIASGSDPPRPVPWNPRSPAPRAVASSHPHRTLETFMRIPASLCAFALVAATPLSLSAAAQTTMKINISVAQNSHYGVAIDTFAREVEARTNGRYRIQTFYAGALGAE